MSRSTTKAALVAALKPGLQAALPKLQDGACYPRAQKAPYTAAIPAFMVSEMDQILEPLAGIRIYDNENTPSQYQIMLLVARASGGSSATPEQEAARFDRAMADREAAVEAIKVALIGVFATSPGIAELRSVTERSDPRGNVLDEDFAEYLGSIVEIDVRERPYFPGGG